jgi:hypothetical protein
MGVRRFPVISVFLYLVSVMNRDFPSLDTKHDKPSAWLQWKGSDVCIDVHCECGAHMHFDCDFLYHVKCSACGQVYEMDGHIQMHKLDHEPEFTKSEPVS